MKSLLLCLLLLVLSVGSTEAQLPRTISYQGVLCDAAGQPKPDSNYSLTFRLYDAAGGGSMIWSEQKSILSHRGLVSTQLGDQVPFGAQVTFERQYWLSIQVNAEPEMVQRVPLSTVGNSFRAAKSDTALYAAFAGSGGSNPWRASGSDIYYSAGAVGIGVAFPSSDLHVIGLDGVVFEGTTGSGAIPAQGSGTRMMWYPRKGAFRAGYTANEWDDVNIGLYSTAMGGFTRASDAYATAMGNSTVASGDYSTAFGNTTTASGVSATAMGDNTTASGNYSTAMGLGTRATGTYSTAIGDATVASGLASTAMGYNVVSDNAGGFIIGDHSTGNTTRTTKDNEFVSVFAGGYTLYTTRDLNQGVYMNGGASGWTNISDRNKKENFRSIDGEELLSKIRSLAITEWNYRGADPSVRYIGPVAQDFHGAFHLGGTDSLGINSICIDGVNIAAVQALERRTADLREKTAELEAVKAEVADLKVRLTRMEAILNARSDVRHEMLTSASEEAGGR